MSLFNGIQVPRFGQLLNRAFSMQQDNPAPQLAGEVQPGLDIWSIPDEYRYLASEYLAVGSGNVGGVALKNSWVSLTNPVGSSLLVVVDSIFFRVTTATLQQVYWSTTLPPNASGTVYQRDGRKVGLPMATCGYGTDMATDWPGAVAAMGFYGNAGAVQEIRHTWVLGPQNSLIVRDTTQGEGFWALFMFRERRIEQSERTQR